MISHKRHVVFMFPGIGSQYTGMAKDLYRYDPIFKSEMDKGLVLIEEMTGEDFKDVLYPAGTDKGLIHETAYAHVLIFLLEYSLACWMMSMGVRPDCVVGHSLGEYVAACISGVFRFEDALNLVITRSKILNNLPPGAMISAAMTEEEARRYLNERVALAAVNGPEQVVFSGDPRAMEQLALQLKVADTDFVKLRSRHAFHSHMQDHLLLEYELEVRKVRFKRSEIRYLSNLSGKFVDPDEVISTDYWIRHSRNTVRFSDCLRTILDDSDKFIFIEVGAGYSLTSLLRQIKYGKTAAAVHLIRSEWEEEGDLELLERTFEELASLGLEVNRSFDLRSSAKH